MRRFSFIDFYLCFFFCLGISRVNFPGTRLQLITSWLLWFNIVQLQLQPQTRARPELVFHYCSAEKKSNLKSLLSSPGPAVRPVRVRKRTAVTGSLVPETAVAGVQKRSGVFVHRAQTLYHRFTVEIKFIYLFICHFSKLPQ